MSVYRTTELIGASKTSWADAAREALWAASSSLRDLRVAEVVEQDLTLNGEGQIEFFRTKLRVSFKFERPVAAPDWTSPRDAARDGSI